MRYCRGFVFLAIMGMTASASLAGTATLNSFQSTAMGKTMTYWVYLPSNYETKKAAGEKFSVIYLLHWYQYAAQGWHDCSFDGCARQNPRMDLSVDSVPNLIGIAPQDEGNGTIKGTSWWINSTACGNVGTFIATDLPAEVNVKYATYGDAAHNGITGCSMGGFGALHHMRANKTVFGKGYGIVSLCDLSLASRPYTCNGSSGTTNYGCGQWELCTDFGSNYWTNTTIINQYSPLANIAGYAGITPFGFSSADGDFFLGDNRSFDAALTVAGIAHAFTVNSTCHEYPNAPRMVEVLKFLFAGGPAPGSTSVKDPNTRGLSRRAATVGPRVSVMLAQGRAMVGGRFVGIDGRALRILPASGIVIGAK